MYKPKLVSQSMYSLVTVLLLTFSCLPLKGYTQVDSTYKIYEEQIRFLLLSRGMEPVEIDSVLLKFSSYGLHSHEQLSVALGSLYPSNQGIAFLVYFYQKDTLQRVWLEPGRVVEMEKIAITKSRLFDLQNRLMNCLSLLNLAANRAPRERGILIDFSSSEDSTDFERSVEEASELLFPKNW